MGRGEQGTTERGKGVGVGSGRVRMRSVGVVGGSPVGFRCGVNRVSMFHERSPVLLARHRRCFGKSGCLTGALAGRSALCFATMLTHLTVTARVMRRVMLNDRRYPHAHRWVC